MNIVNKFNPALHGLRGIAAMAVLLFHWSQFYPDIPSKLNFELLGQHWDFSLWFDMGWLGVPLFFVLSGYLLGGQLSQKELTKENLIKFWSRRFLRIYPAFWFQLAILLIIGTFIGLYSISNWGDGIRHILLWINLPPWMTPPINGVWWTLPIELSFYLLLPLLVFVQRKIGITKLVLLSFTITVAWRASIMQLNPDIYYVRVLPVLDALPGSLTSFVAGLAVVFTPKTELKSKKIILVLSLVGLYLLTSFLSANIDTYWTGHWLLMVFNPAVAVVLAAILYSTLSPFYGTRFLSSRFFIWLGEVSFGIYLWHFPVFQIMKQVWPELGNGAIQGIVALIVCLVATFVMAQISFRYIEKPIMHWNRSSQGSKKVELPPKLL